MLDEFLRMMLLLDDLNAVISCLVDAAHTDSEESQAQVFVRPVREY